MESETDRDSFGGYLKGFRLQRNLAIETVSERTKIAVACLTAIEQDAHDRLPPRAYVKSFIRSYAGAVGADADVALALYAADNERRVHVKQRRLRRRAKLSVLRRTLLAVGLVTGILLLVRYGNVFMNHSPPPVETSEHAALADASVDGAEIAGSGPPAAPSKKKLKLQVVAVEHTWLKVIVDGQHARSYDLKPADRLELEGSTTFNLMIGNATGLKIFLDDRPVKIFGSSGQVVSLKIP
ncbi:MAG: RodZ domain-containing protein [Desulfosarcina sp.]